MFCHWVALPTGSASRSRDHFSAKFGWSLGLHVRQKPASCRRFCGEEFLILRFSSPGVCRLLTLAGSDSLSTLQVLVVFVYYGKAVWRNFWDRCCRETSAEISGQEDTGVSFIQILMGSCLSINGPGMVHIYERFDFLITAPTIHINGFIVQSSFPNCSVAFHYL